MRGRKSDQERLTAHVGFEITPTDKARIVSDASAVHLHLAEYIRRKLLSAHMPKAGRDDPQVVRELLTSINRYADALETLARHPDRRIEDLFPEEDRKQLVLKLVSL
jgi:hypothetical protein